MIKKIYVEMQNICTAAKISIIFSALMATVLLIGAFFLSFNDNYGLWIRYISEMMAVVSVRIFSVGIFLALCGDFLMSAVDRRGK